MRHIRTVGVALLAAWSALLVSGCAASQQDATVVMAAASLTEAFTELAAEFESRYPDADIQLNFGGSSSLREQILEGAPASVFASANQPTMQQVIDAGEAESSQDFASNRLVIAVPRDRVGTVTSLADFARHELLLGLCAEGVPCGDFARDALRLAGVAPAPDTNEADVRALLTKVAAGELDAGRLYATDAQAENAVTGIEIADQVQVAINYPIAVLSQNGEPAEVAEQFVQFVFSVDGQAVLMAHGFGKPA